MHMLSWVLCVCMRARVCVSAAKSNLFGTNSKLLETETNKTQVVRWVITNGQRNGHICRRDILARSVYVNEHWCHAMSYTVYTHTSARARAPRTWAQDYTKTSKPAWVLNRVNLMSDIYTKHTIIGGQQQRWLHRRPKKAKGGGQRQRVRAQGGSEITARRDKQNKIHFWGKRNEIPVLWELDRFD